MLGIYGPTGDHGNLEAHANFEIIKLSLFRSKRIVMDWNELEASMLLNSFSQMRQVKKFYFTKKNWDMVSTNLVNGGYTEAVLSFVLHVEKIISGSNKKVLTKRYMDVKFEEVKIKFVGPGGMEGGGSFSLIFRDLFRTWV